MGVLTDQVINNWAQLPKPSYWDPGNFIDAKSSFGKSSIKSEILAPSHSVSINPVSVKAEVDLLAFLDIIKEEGLSLNPLVQANQAIFQSVEIKQLFKLVFKGEKEIAFKTKGQIEFNEIHMDPELKTDIKDLVKIFIIISTLASIASEALAITNNKVLQNGLWASMLATSRVIFVFFNGYIIEKILASVVVAVAPAHPVNQNNPAHPPNQNDDGGVGAGGPPNPAAAALQRIDPPVDLVENRADAAAENPDLIPQELQAHDNDVADKVFVAIEVAENGIAQVRISAAAAAAAAAAGDGVANPNG